MNIAQVAAILKGAFGFVQSSSGTINANVNLRTGTLSALQSIQGGASEVGITTDGLEIVSMGGASFPQPTFYSGTSWANSGLTQKIYDSSNSSLVVTNGSTIGGSYNTLFGVGLVSGYTGVYGAVGYGFQVNATAYCAGAFGVAPSARFPNVLTIGNRNQIGGLNAGDLVLTNDAFHSLTGMPVIKGVAHLHGTTTNATALALTLDAGAPVGIQAVPAAPTAVAHGVSGSGTLSIGTYYVGDNYRRIQD